MTFNQNLVRQSQNEIFQVLICKNNCGKTRHDFGSQANPCICFSLVIMKRSRIIFDRVYIWIGFSGYFIFDLFVQRVTHDENINSNAWKSSNEFWLLFKEFIFYSKEFSFFNFSIILWEFLFWMSQMFNTYPSRDTTGSIHTCTLWRRFVGAFPCIRKGLVGSIACITVDRVAKIAILVFQWLHLSSKGASTLAFPIDWENDA